MDTRRWLTAARLLATYPQRRRLNRHDAANGRAPLMVLFYHRVADTRLNDWTISCDLFAWQLRWLQRNVELISLTEMQRRLRTGHNPRSAACITFDDGYADNFDFALPLLIRQQIPCTYFVASRHILQGKPFPHDLAANQPLEPNSPAQLREVADKGIEIGCHTRNHADLGRVRDPDELQDEIVVARDELTDLVGAPVDYFAFPYGQPENVSMAAIQVARQAGFKGVCYAYGGYNRPGADPFQIQRIHADPERIRFLNWMTIDARKWAMHPPLFPPQHDPSSDLQPA